MLDLLLSIVLGIFFFLRLTALLRLSSPFMDLFTGKFFRSKGRLYLLDSAAILNRVLFFSENFPRTEECLAKRSLLERVSSVYKVMA